MGNGRIFDEPTLYQIRVKGELHANWSDWFEGFTITARPDNETILVGAVADQAALHGLLAKLRDIGLPILLVKRLEKQNYE